jgi:hypothetical protein
LDFSETILKVCANVRWISGAAWQFLNKVADPRISTLRKFAKAMGVSVEELVGDKRKG